MEILFLIRIEDLCLNFSEIVFHYDWIEDLYLNFSEIVFHYDLIEDPYLNSFVTNVH